jgi:hypothetical protein
VLEEYELTIPLQDPSNSLNSLNDTRNRAQSKGAHNCVDSRVWQWDALSGQVDKLDIQVRSEALFLCSSKHPSVGLERVNFAYSRLIVVNEVHTGPNADLQNSPLCPRNDLFPDFLDGLRIAEHAYEVGINMFSIERHNNLIAGPVLATWHRVNHCFTQVVAPQRRSH